MSEGLAQPLLLAGLTLLPVTGAQAEPPKDPLKPPNLARDVRTHLTADQTAKGQACGVRGAPHRDQLYH
jgi:hypothetical protein